MKKRSLLRRFVAYYKPHKGLFALDILASFTMAAIGLFYPIITRRIFNVYVKESNVNAIIICAVILVGVYVLRFLLKLFVDYFGHKIGVLMQAQMRHDIFAKFESLPFSYYDEHETGELMSRLTTDLMQVSELAHHGPENIFICSVSIIGAFVYLLTVNWILALMIFACVPILFVIALLTRQKQLKAFEETRKDIGAINADIASSLSGIRVTRAFNCKDNEIDYFDKVNKKFVSSRLNAYKYMSYFHSSTNFITDLFYAVCIAGGALIVIKTNAFSIEDYLAFAVSIALFITPVNQLVNFVEQFQDGAAGFKRFSEIMDEEEEKDKEGAKNDVELSGNIEFKNVCFKYESSDEILNDVSFSIKKGETIALVGTSGGGKTTICHLLPHFYKKEKGEILFDGIKIEDIANHALRENIGIVQQDVFLFNGSIQSNIRYGKLDATDEEIIEAAKKANIYDFVMSLPDGFKTKVGERGIKLSGGQKQRISIARIFLKNPSILVLDEATSALDNTTEVAIQKSLNDLAKGRTSIIVAHRLSTIKNADRIFVVNHGHIVESGSHKELMALNGEYAKLYNEQFALN